MLPHLQDTLRFRYNVSAELRALRSPRDAGRMVQDALRFAWHRARGDRPVMKDPIALFAAEWLARRLNMQVVVIIRHPAAFVSSVKRMKWTHPFDHFLQQELLMRDHLAEFAEEFVRFAKVKQDIVLQGCLLWRVTHSMIDRFRQRQENWIFVRHEDLSRDPLRGFASLYASLGLEFDERAGATIARFSAADNPHEAPRGRSTIRRASKTSIHTWRTRLGADEVDTVRTQVSELASRFYAPEEW